MCRERSAFTLIELLVVILIMGVIGGVVVACFMGGMRAYERVHEFGQNEADVYLALELIERDLRNTVNIRDAGFEGSSYVMQFPAMGVFDGDSGNDDIESSDDVRLVRYWHDAQSGLMRSSATLEDGAFSVDGDSLTGRGANINFEYGGIDDSGAFVWSDEWMNASNLPRMVRVNFMLGDGESAEASRTILLPMGGRLKE